jgi:hypothetical protein
MDTSEETTNETSKSTADETAKITAKPADAAIAAPNEPAAEPARNDAPAALSKIEAPKPETIAAATSDAPKIASPKIEIAEIAAAPPAPATKPITAGARRLGLMAASLALATACGALAGALGASGWVGRAPASESTPSDESRVMKDAIAQLHADIAALKASVDTANRNSNAQISKISERFDRADRSQTEAATTLARETTGSIATAPAIAVPLPQPAPPPPIVSGWVVRDVSRGMALIEGRIGLIEVEPGDVVPGLGRIEAVRRQDGRWVVVTAKGIVASR